MNTSLHGQEALPSVFGMNFGSYIMPLTHTHIYSFSVSYKRSIAYSLLKQIIIIIIIWQGRGIKYRILFLYFSYLTSWISEKPSLATTGLGHVLMTNVLHSMRI